MLMLKEGNMFDAKFTQREATYIFVRTNLEDELYACDNSNDDSEDFTCNAEEFETCVARLCNEKVPEAYNEKYSVTLDSFLSLVFVPTYRTVLKKRGVTVPVEKAAEKESQKRKEESRQQGGE